jgi:hypothetical protein
MAFICLLATRLNWSHVLGIVNYADTAYQTECKVRYRHQICYSLWWFHHRVWFSIVWIWYWHLLRGIYLPPVVHFLLGWSSWVSMLVWFFFFVSLARISYNGGSIYQQICFFWCLMFCILHNFEHLEREFMCAFDRAMFWIPRIFGVINMFYLYIIVPVYNLHVNVGRAQMCLTKLTYISILKID